MSVDDHGLEVLKKAALAIDPLRPKAEYVLRTTDLNGMPVGTDYVQGANVGADFIITFKKGGSGGTVLRTYTLFNKTGCPFELGIS